MRHPQRPACGLDSIRPTHAGPSRAVELNLAERRTGFEDSPGTVRPRSRRRDAVSTLLVRVLSRQVLGRPTDRPRLRCYATAAIKTSDRIPRNPGRRQVFSAAASSSQTGARPTGHWRPPCGRSGTPHQLGVGSTLVTTVVCRRRAGLRGGRGQDAVPANRPRQAQEPPRRRPCGTRLPLPRGPWIPVSPRGPREVEAPGASTSRLVLADGLYLLPVRRSTRASVWLDVLVERAFRGAFGWDIAEPYGVTFVADPQATAVFDQPERRHVAYTALSAHSHQKPPFERVAPLRNYRGKAQEYSIRAGLP